MPAVGTDREAVAEIGVGRLVAGRMVRASAQERDAVVEIGDAAAVARLAVGARGADQQATCRRPRVLPSRRNRRRAGRAARATCPARSPRPDGETGARLGSRRRRATSRRRPGTGCWRTRAARPVPSDAAAAVAPAPSRRYTHSDPSPPGTPVPPASARVPSPVSATDWPNRVKPSSASGGRSVAMLRQRSPSRANRTAVPQRRSPRAGWRQPRLSDPSSSRPPSADRATLGPGGGNRDPAVPSIVAVPAGTRPLAVRS